MRKNIFKAVYIIGMLAEIVIRMPHERQRQQQHVVVERVSARERGVLGLLALGMLFIPVLYMLTHVLDRADYRLSAKTKARMGAGGTLILAGALWLFHRSHADLGRNWSPTLQVREDHDLVTNGVYRHIRHPMYASQLLWIVAQPLLLQNWIAGWASLLPFLSLYLLRVPRDEQMMREQFGEAYQVYMHRTGGIVPRFRT
jgi:protein-S-isoprenylcysteine O-methyltransferase Ste14